MEAANGGRKWNAIFDYTVFGPYFWTGKGYGINLLDDAGLQVLAMTVGSPERSPENSHLTILARSGVPGFLLWVVLQLTWAVAILRVFVLRATNWPTPNRGTDDFPPRLLDGIHGPCRDGRDLRRSARGIWFWTLFGVGAAGARVVRRDAEFFERMDFGRGRCTSRHVSAHLKPPHILRKV